MDEFEEDRGAAEAHAINRGGAASGINVASKDDEVKENAGIVKKYYLTALLRARVNQKI